MAQGSKQVQLGGKVFSYGPGGSMLTTIDLPVAAHVTQSLRRLYVRERAHPEVEGQVNDWYRSSLQYVGQRMGVDYAARCQTTRASGMGIQGFPVAKMGMVDGIDSRLQHLVTFLTEVRQRR
jgi:hypothetical protein